MELAGRADLTEYLALALASATPEEVGHALKYADSKHREKGYSVYRTEMGSVSNGTVSNMLHTIAHHVACDGFVRSRHLVLMNDYLGCMLWHMSPDIHSQYLDLITKTSIMAGYR
jgi:hypothetical protein